MNAYQEIQDYMEKGEQIENLMFIRDWGFFRWTPSVPVPDTLFGRIIMLEDAKKYMLDWQFSTGHGDTQGYNMNVWTNKRVIYVNEYDNATSLAYVLRNPIKRIKL